MEKIYRTTDQGSLRLRVPPPTASAFITISPHEQERLGAEGAYHASPLAADGRIYFSSTSGTVTVVAVGSTLKILARNALGEAIIAYPRHRQLQALRAHARLWAFGK